MKKFEIIEKIDEVARLYKNAQIAHINADRSGYKADRVEGDTLEREYNKAVSALASEIIQSVRLQVEHDIKIANL